MHTHTIDHEGETFRVHAHGDWSGDILIDVPAERMWSLDAYPGQTDAPPGYRVAAPMEVILEIAGRFLLDRQVARLEDMSGREALERL